MKLKTFQETLDIPIHEEAGRLEDALTEYLRASDLRAWEELDPLFNESLVVAMARHVVDSIQVLIDSNEELQKDLEDLYHDKEKLEAEVKELKTEEDYHVEEIESLDARIKELESETEDLWAKNQELKQQNQELIEAADIKVMGPLGSLLNNF